MEEQIRKIMIEWTCPICNKYIATLSQRQMDVLIKQHNFKHEV